ncbi:phage protein NinX family protein [Xenorhabdus eapokensis]|uniref:DUF2591 domain-containing protein n=1 Tax=Xenorhabdus eapokensis TaxID=1873482 RepID=A0A1Q5TPS0_9GAMM|nr:phage protein NinX family protein [Xenorhabdus eapokensis]OKP02214.1 hypothetical protein Xedl_02373 [Xenorhabdus eapokensis]
MKIKTSALTGRALDWAVAKADARGVKINELGYVFVNDNRSIGVYSPSADWAKCGQLIEKHYIELNFNSVNEEWSAYIFSFEELESVIEDGESPTIAICRAVVAAKLGDEVEIPDELVEGVNDNG